MISRAYSCVLFDLDGTLTDPAEGITRCIAYALEQLQAPVPQQAELLRWIGPPLRQNFAAYLHSDTLAGQALALYRERFATEGIFENRLYPGVPSLLADVQASGCRLFLASAKPLPYVERILEHFGLSRYFAGVAGASLDGHVSSKQEVIGLVIPQLASSERTTCVMVGDRRDDILGARAHQLPCIAVSYGYGSRAELRACQPAEIVDSLDELRAALLGATPA